MRYKNARNFCMGIVCRHLSLRQSTARPQGIGEKLVRGKLANGGLVCPEKKFSNSVHGIFGITIKTFLGDSSSSTNRTKFSGFFRNGKSQ